MTWITPFDAWMSVMITRASLTKTESPSTLIDTSEPWAVVADCLARWTLDSLGKTAERVLGDGVTRLRHRVTATLGIQGQQQLHQNLARLLDSL